MVRLLLDTQVLVWIPLGDRRLTQSARTAIADPENQAFVSAAVAFEFADLHARGRLPLAEQLEVVTKSIDAAIVALPAECWSLAAALPRLHGDPVDRMLIAHALLGDFTLVTADATIRRYPVRTMW